MNEWIVASPDNLVILTFAIEQAEDGGNAMFYRVAYQGQPLVEDSMLGLVLRDAAPLCRDFTVLDVQTRTFHECWQPVYGERSSVVDHFTEMIVALKEAQEGGRNLTLRFRAYNEGVALQYHIPEQDGFRAFVIEDELTQFAFAPDSTVYAEYWPEDVYHPIRVRELEKRTERPLTVACTNGRYACVHEAGMNHHAKMLLAKDERRPDLLRASLAGPTKGEAPFDTPWRLLIVGERPGDLTERSDLVLHLNRPCALEDTTWIRPGKAIRETTLTTRGGKACVQFAKAHRLQYIEFDAGWYGSETNDREDATTVSVDPQRKRPDWDELNLPEVIAYAAEHGIGVWLYVNRRHLERQLDTLLPLYSSWGVKGIKFGFVNEGPQEWTEWLLEAVRKCAEHRLMVDIHDYYRPTGYARTYPNLLTVEGIRGNEHFPTAAHNCTLPFTRFPGGPGDYTICYYTNRLKNTRAHQLAMSVIVYSPLQFVFWYDSPSDYGGEPEVEFLECVHTVWDDTKAPLGSIGEFVAIARRKGEEWFIGTITNEQPRTLAVPLSMLEKNRSYSATIYEDDHGTGDGRRVAIRRLTVDSESCLQANLLSCGGQAVHLMPV
ncbi:glycoside hydrolase family 97 catalytic domain-containing protein [Paenibacillus allorhizosphaerae]|uniref:Glucan 1,4-alpha-glucosidase SusB n=1 Tax=Paenibacillus allorhizosphaerae TaxID=2849866 RepID=A0ABN7TNH6_9BACL|nr:glycoside hydrolase family 97 protein [Paenibacillus allorhizosphaerae]CAG7648643.1 Glucan 1,4-alpha-glucosidase SusB [Paenibacillus allorhizosphaerae]